MLVIPETSLVNSKDPDEILHGAAFHLGQHCLRRQKYDVNRKK